MSSAKPIRVTLLAHAATAAMRFKRFPRPDDPLDNPGCRALRRLPLRPDLQCVTSPARRAVETAAAIGLPVRPEPLLDDQDPGRWAGLSIAEVAAAEPDHLAAWLGGSDAAPHGGETSAAVAARAARWLDAQEQAVLAVTHAAVIRAAVALTLQVPPALVGRIDVAPLCVCRLSGRPGRWRLSCLNLPFARHAAETGALSRDLR